MTRLSFVCEGGLGLEEEETLHKQPTLEITANSVVEGLRTQLHCAHPGREVTEVCHILAAAPH